MSYDYESLITLTQSISDNTKIMGYKSETDSLATIGASGYFVADTSNDANLANIIEPGNFICVSATDGADLFWVSGIDPIALVSVQGSSPTTLNLAQGWMLVGNASGKAAALNTTTDGSIIIGNGTTVTSIGVSGAATLSNTGVLTLNDGVVGTSKLADGALTAGAKFNIPAGSILIGNASTHASNLDIKTSGNIIVGNGTGAASVAVSGDGTLSSAGVLTISGGTITPAKMSLTQGLMIVGAGGNVGTTIDNRTSGNIMVGNGTTVVSVAMSGDATLSSAGALTIAAGAVETSMLANGAVTAGAKIALTEGSIFVGNGSNQGVELDCSTSGYVLVGNGTTVASVEMHGDATIAADGTVTIASGAVDVDDLALAEGNIIVGNGGGVGSALNAKTSGQILVGNGTTLASVLLSGDVSMNSSGAVTIAAGAVETSMLADGAVAAGAKIALTEGNIFIGNASNQGALLDISDDGKILVGNGTTATSVAVSGDATLSNAGVLTITATPGKITLAEGSVIVGNAGGVGAALDAKTSGQILVGNGTTVISAAVSGDATLSAAGALTIANNAITTAKIADDQVTPNKLGGMPFYVAYGGKVTWTGSGATLTPTVTGVLTTDIVEATIQTAPSEAAYLVSAAPGTDDITLTLSAANTSNDAVISYIVYRATP